MIISPLQKSHFWYTLGMDTMPKPAQPEVKTSPRKSAPSLNLVLTYLLFICLGILIAKFAFDKFTPHFMPAAKTPAVAAAALPKPPVPAVQLPSPIQAVKKSLKKAVEPYELNGIYLSGSDSYALVNNQIVQIGDEINGATVLKIAAEEVQLSHNNKIIHLISKNK
jgi:hypothetical protein